MAQQKQTQLVSMRMWVQFLTPLGWLRIWHYHELWCTSEMQLRFRVSVAVAWAGSCSSDLTLSLRTSMCHGCDRKNRKLKKKKKEEIQNVCQIPLCEWYSSGYAWPFNYLMGGLFFCNKIKSRPCCHGLTTNRQ